MKIVKSNTYSSNKEKLIDWVKSGKISYEEAFEYLVFYISDEEAYDMIEAFSTDEDYYSTEV